MKHWILADLVRGIRSVNTKLSSRVPSALLMTALMVKHWSGFYSMTGEMVDGLLDLQTG